MKSFVRVGRRILNLRYLVDALEVPPDRIRLTLTDGRAIDLDADESAELRAALDRLVPRADAPDPGPPPSGWRSRPPLL